MEVPAGQHAGGGGQGRCNTVRMRSRGAALTTVGPVGAPSGGWRELRIRYVS